ncbi:hypothetical protein ALQ04_04070 [Pseudomonas cichorii]|uniref:Uncharacterized protein n=1 Tax=Pseudomonas cichorii TaxID=36746 RepID=A0A3M4M310_PSECI|nr:hypothetical protein [Pseudomonas cichorii]RMQ47641.1 hypothetical protein ALQ04_04070 [Pseudomonas cichorii]
MNRQCTVWGLSAALLGISGVANADVEWWLIFGGGEQPNREMFYADASSVVELKKESGMKEFPKTVDVLQIHEAASGPEYVNYQFQFQCESKLMRVVIATAHMRSGTNVMAPAPPGWFPLRYNWTQQPYQFACHPENRTKNGMFNVNARGADVAQMCEITRRMIWKNPPVDSAVKERPSASVMRDIQTLLGAPGQ